MNEPQPDAALLQLMEEMVAAKQAVQEVLKISPEDVPLHRIHGMYTGHILDIRKTILQEQAADKDQLLIAAPPAPGDESERELTQSCRN